MSHPLPPLRPYVNEVQSTDVRFPRIGELVLIRLPFNMPGPTSIISSSAISGSNSYNYHPCVVINMSLGPNDWEIEVFTCRSYTNESDPVSYVSSLSPADRSLLLPLPSNPRPDTPAGFGAPLLFGNSYFSQKPGWLIAKSFNVKMGGNSAYKPFQPQAILPVSEIDRIRTWLAAAVPGTTSTLLLPPGMGGTGDSATRFHRQQGTFVIQSPQDNDSDDYDPNNDPYVDIFYSDASFPMEVFQLADPNSNFWAAEVARQEAERRNVVQQWIMNL